MLQARNINITMHASGRTMIEDLSFTLQKGEHAALIGEEGNGKSTLLKWLYDPKSVEEYAVVQGERRIDGVMGYLPQELPKTDVDKTVAEYLEGTCELFCLSPKEVASAARKLHVAPGLFYSDQTMGTLSGGERVKIQIAALLFRQCDLLLLDEPTNDLDLETVEWLESFLQAATQTVLFISHDELLLRRVATMVLHLEQVRRKTIPRATVSRRTYDDYLEEREAKFAHQAQIAQFEHDAFRKKKERYLSIYQSVEHAQNSVSRGDPHSGRLLKKKMHCVTSIGRRLEKEEANLTEAPEAEWAILPKWKNDTVLPQGRTVLDFHLPRLTIGERTLAENIHLYASGGERICILGPNGCGKTTLLHLLYEDLITKPNLRVGFMPQRYDRMLDLQKTPVAFLAPNGDKASVTEARIYLGSMKYTTEEMEHPIAALSGGQQAKLLLLSLILSDADVLVLDEPTRNFSPLSAPAVRQLLSSYRGTIVSVTHDRKYLEEVATSVYRLEPSGLKKLNLCIGTGLHLEQT